MFWDRYYSLCHERGKSPNGVASELGFSTSTATQWKRGAIPEEKNQQKIADYFGVTVPYLLDYTDDRNQTTRAEVKKTPAEAEGSVPDFIRIPELYDVARHLSVENLQKGVEYLRLLKLEQDARSSAGPS